MSAAINREEEAKNPGMEKDDHLRGAVHPLLGVHELDS
jgi:hypothetical protein